MTPLKSNTKSLMRKTICKKSLAEKGYITFTTIFFFSFYEGVLPVLCKNFLKIKNVTWHVIFHRKLLLYSITLIYIFF